MSETPIKHVADTAFWVATYRAEESARPDALFRDPLAARLVEGRGRAIAAEMSDGRLIAWSLVMRTVIIDEFILGAIAAGCDAVLNLGAGLDTRPYRMELPSSLQWIEVDFPDTIAFKDEQLAGEAPRCALKRVAVDLGDDAARKRLLDEVAIGKKKILVLTEGVVPYLSVEATSALSADLTAHENYAWWVLDYFSPQVHAFRRARMKRRAQQMAAAPFKFIPDDWFAFFAERGWRVKQMRYLGEEGVRLKRRAPLPFLARVMRLFSSSERRKQMGRLIGYALLERTPK